MPKQAHFLILLLFFAFWQPAPAQDVDSAPSLSQGDSAQVIYQIRGRVYIDKGALDGIDNSWQIDLSGLPGHNLNLPLSWIGDDISSFNIPDSLSLYFQEGLQIALLRLQNQSGPGYKIILAYPHLPALPHEGAVDYYDREFQGLISPDLQINRLKTPGDSSISIGNEIASYHFNIPESRYCGNSPVRLNDAYYTLQYYKQHVIPESYAIKYLPPLDDPLNIYWDTIMDVCVPASGFADDIGGLFNCARFNTLMPSSDNGGYNLTADPEQMADSPPEYESGYGPYTISKKTDEQIVLLRNKGCLASQAFPDTIIIRVEPDYLKRKLMFQLGEIDFLDLNFSDVEQFENDYKVKKAELDEAAYLTINNLKPMLSDGMLMTALSYLINKDGLCRIALGKSALPLDNLIDKWKNEVKPMYKYDKNKGQSLINNFGKGRRYLSLFISPDDFLNRRTAEYIKGILERQNIYVTIYSKMQEGEGRSYDLFQQFDMMIGRIDRSLDDPMYILNQTAFHYDLDNITRNRSLYYSENIDSTMAQSLQNPDMKDSTLKDFYHRIIEFPAGLTLFKPIRQVAAANRIKIFELTKDGFIDFSSIEIKNEAER